MNYMNFKKNNMENVRTFAVVARFAGGFEQEVMLLETEKTERQLLKEFGPSISYLGKYNDRSRAEQVKQRIEERNKRLPERKLKENINA